MNRFEQWTYNNWTTILAACIVINGMVLGIMFVVLMVKEFVN